MTFDLAVSGVVRNALRIAQSAQSAGLKTELWVAQRAGQLLDQVPDGISVSSLGSDVGTNYTGAQRKRALKQGVLALAGLMSERRPAIAFSAGNHFHGAAAAAFRMGGEHGSTRLIGRVSNALPRFRWSTLPYSWVRVRKARKRLAAMDRLVAVSEEIKDQLETEMVIDSAKLEVIPNGIDVAAVQTLGNEAPRHAWFADASVPVVLGVGRLVPQKGFDVLIRAFALARQHIPMRLVIVGDGPERDQLKKLASDLAIAEHVWFAGFAANPMPFYKAADVFVSSSRWEGMSNALLEALAAGCPVISTPVPGSAELLAEGRFGRLVAPDDPKHLAAAIAGTLVEPLPPEVLIERAAAYDLQAGMKRYVRLFEEEVALVASPDRLQGPLPVSRWVESRL